MHSPAITHIGPPSLYGRLLKFLARLAFKLLLGADNLSAQDARKRLDMVGALSSRLSGVKRITTKVGGLHAQWLNADTATTDGPVILYLHGGGYVSGSVKSHWEMAARLARAARARCLIVDYRLAPEHPFPAPLEDSMAAWQWLLERDIKPEQIVLAGDSAGGGLSLATSLKLRELGMAQPAGIYCMSPWTDVSLSGDSVISKRREEVVLCNPTGIANAANDYAADQDRTQPLMSPVFADLKGLPPILLHTGTDEVLLDDSIRLHSNALATGVDCQLKLWEGMWHVWPLFDKYGLPEARHALQDAARFIHTMTLQATTSTERQAAAA